MTRIRSGGGDAGESLATTRETKDDIWGFPKIGVPYFRVLIKRILLFRVLY